MWLFTALLDYKHLENLIFNYDMTVRYNNGSIVQYLHGEDGLEVKKAVFQ